MKISAKQIIIMVMGLLLLFIPSYIAFSYYYSNNANSVCAYSLIIYDEDGTAVSVDRRENDKIAETFLKINSKMIAINGTPARLPDKYYSVTVRKDGATLSSYLYYIVAEKDADSYIRSVDGKYYAVKYSDAKALLTGSFAHHFYENADIPSLSINGGNEIIPIQGSWQYRTAGGSMQRRQDLSLANTVLFYSMGSDSSLSFSTEPKQCTVQVYKDGQLIGKYNDLNDIPYGMIDGSGVTFRIEAKWDSADYKGSAKYEFAARDQSLPVYRAASTSILSGEFFVITAENVDIPSKIKFSSIPEIGVDVLFFKDGDRAVALIPINKELAAPTDYTFTFSYGNNTQTMMVHVDGREIYHKSYGVELNRSESNLHRYASLMSTVGTLSEGTRYFSGKFLDYAPPSSSGDAKLADVFFGFGHRIVPSNDTSQYRLDGVVYMLADGAEVPVIATGRVICTGEDPLLGLFAVVEHGFGLKTWYCNLSSVSVAVGDVIERGRSVGVSGATGYRGINGVYLITTVHGIPVSPYPLQENQSIIPE